MAKIFLTGSADGLGHLAAKELILMGHQVVLHARNEERADETFKKLNGAQDILIADLSSMEETKALAEKANAFGVFDAVIHNAGIYQVDRNSVTVDGFPLLLAVNSLAPYILTALMHQPKRLIYLSSDMHLQGNPSKENLLNSKRNQISYSDTKLHDLTLSMAVARKWSNVYSNAVDPGWVPTKMGGTGAPGNLQNGYETQLWLAVSDDKEAMVSGQYFHHKKQVHYLQAAKEIAVQEQLLAAFKTLTGIEFTIVRSQR
ncbi:MAG: SDR family NAD(P)-dependent oxidoreductase [Chryseobacterium sp.]|nr:MAG: SDR family NAD(P)-dependent oxidoreductase [Chryseobacterium sp.]